MNYKNKIKDNISAIFNYINYEYENNLKFLKRFLHVLNFILSESEKYDKLLKNIYEITENMVYHPPWDEEYCMCYNLEKLAYYCSFYYPGPKSPEAPMTGSSDPMTGSSDPMTGSSDFINLNNVFTENILLIPLNSEINKFLSL